MTKNETPLIEIHHLSKNFYKKEKKICAVDDVHLTIYTGETLGLVGESGCGKSTLGRTLLQLYKPSKGHVIYKGRDLCTMKKKELKGLRSDLQIIFQDPYASLDPRMTVTQIVGESLDIHSLITTNAEREEKVRELLSLVGLKEHHMNRYPHEFSGGQRQRIGIARALAVNPRFIVCDEPLSALDVSIQAQIVNLLKDLQDKMGLTYLFISHDLSMVKYLSDRVAVMYLGMLVELAENKTLYSSSLHPYTSMLLSAIPRISDDGATSQHNVKGDLPSPLSPPSGCPFHPRCPHAMKVCSEKTPCWQEHKPGHYVRCFLYE
jgi:oligopeptide/dipeptide ABC transporter ATP-binding protein